MSSVSFSLPTYVNETNKRNFAAAAPRVMELNIQNLYEYKNVRARTRSLASDLSHTNNIVRELEIAISCTQKIEWKKLNRYID